MYLKVYWNLKVYKICYSLSAHKNLTVHFKTKRKEHKIENANHRTL